VKKFSFGLERVLEWRAGQVESEKIKLRRLFDERHALEAAGVILDREQAEEERTIRSQANLEAQQLSALGAFQRHVKNEKLRLAGQIADCGRRIAEQRQRLLEVRRQFRLLERMKQRDWEAWNRALAGETDALAAEAHLAQRIKMNRGSADR